MKPKVVFLTVAVLGNLLFGQTQTKDTVTHEVQGRSHMTKIKLGEDAKMMALPTDRERLQKFYRDVLGCRVTTKSDSFDLIQFGRSFFIGVVYDEAALKDADARKAIWPEIRTADPEALKQKILVFGVKQVEFWDRDHFYSQAPGGQVFRLVGTTEDMSKWQR